MSIRLVDLAPGAGVARKLTPASKEPTSLLPLSLSFSLILSIPMLDKNTLFAVSLFPYLGFLWFMTRTKETPRLALIGFYALLVFVAVTIPAGIYAKVGLGEELANVDWLHGGAESFLTLSNIFVVLGFRQAVVQHRASSSVEEKSQNIA